MCGIAGILSFHNNASFMIQHMNHALRHRGPDDSGIFIDEKNGIYLSHNRLAVIDLSLRARQPFFNETQDIVAVINGEIYNFLELKSDLAKDGHYFCSDSDAEVIVHAYEKWGEDFIHKLKGMFAIALWDKKQNKFILARDPLGIKPLYYLKTEKIFAFASELRTFLSLDEDCFVPEINSKAVETLLLFPFIFDDDVTMFKGVCKLPPGHLLIIKNKKVTLRCYWKLESRTELSPYSFSQARQVLEEKLSAAVSSHLRSDAQIGIFLSGGVDSSLLSALAAKTLKEPIRTFTAHFHHPGDEHVYAAKVANHIGAKHTAFYIDLNEVSGRIQEIIWSFDGLSCVDAGFITLYLLAEKMKSCGIRVILNGEGADEVFGGYPWFSFSGFPFNILPPSLRNNLLYFRLSKNLSKESPHQDAAIFCELIDSLDKKDIFRQISKWEIRYQLPNHFLMKVDKATMAHGVETRVPYLDRDVVEFAYHLPSKFKRRPLKPDKLILRAVAQKYLPEDIAWRKKQGFLFPVVRMLQENDDKIRDYLLKGKSFSRQFFPQKKIRGLLKIQNSKRHLLNPITAAMLWKLFVIELWHERFQHERSQRNFDNHFVETPNSSCI